MTPYNIYHFTYNRCLNHFFFWQEKETLHQRKSACSLRSPAAPMGARPRSFHHEAWLHDEKSPVTSR